jgi:hypothetical protein
MRTRVALILALFTLTSICCLTDRAFCVSRPHSVTFGKWVTVRWSPDIGEENTLTMKVRPLLVDDRIKEFSLGSAHEVTDRLFVVRRAFRVNDSLPQESGNPHWQWQRGGWLLVDRITGHVTAMNLPDFDAFYSAASWYRDYAAYCGISADGKKAYAVVAQISRRKPLLKKPLDASIAAAELKDVTPDSACPAPTWQRSPIRVSFEPAGAEKQTFSIRGHFVDVVSEEDDEEAAK